MYVSIWEAEARRPEIPSHPQLHNKFKISLGYMGLCLKNRSPVCACMVPKSPNIASIFLQLPCRTDSYRHYSFNLKCTLLDIRFMAKTLPPELMELSDGQ